MMALPPALVWRETITAALREDFGRRGDVTTRAIISPAATCTASFAARQDGVVCGLPVAAEVFALLDPALRFEAMAKDGDAIHAGAVVATVSGMAIGVLEGERVALNFLSRMSGIATLTAHYVTAVEGTAARICCTRKTTPGLRVFEKYAVACGGGVNHRYGLDDAILIKDNHIAVAGGIGPAIMAARAAAGHMLKIEIEVDTLAQLEEALAHKVDAILLDNFSADDLKRAVDAAQGRVTLEASGGVNLKTVRSIAQSGVDLISVGALTHSAPVFDFGLDIG